jgi:Zn-dependent alcohol dehydrogenase
MGLISKTWRSPYQEVAKFLSTCRRQAFVIRISCSPLTTSHLHRRCWVTRSRGSWQQSVLMSRTSVSAITLNISGAIGAQKRVVGVNFGSTNAKRDIPMYAQPYLQGGMNLDDLVSRRISLREVNDGYAALKDGSLNRVVVTSF